MIYLIAKIFLYMLLTLAIGFAAGWLSRNIASVKREEELQKSVTESRSRVPQFESLMRTRDEQVRKLRDEVGGKDKRIAELSAELQSKEEQARRAQREVSKLTSRNEALEGVAEDDSESSEVLMGDGVIDAAGPVATENTAASDALRTELHSVKQQLADAIAEAASAEAELAAARQESSGSVNASEVKELQARVRQQASEHEQLNKALDTEQRKVIELGRERELQNKSLQVLHQQLELERERTGQVPGATPSDPAQAARH